VPDNTLTFVLALVTALWLFAGVAMRVAAIGIIPARRKPSTGMAWLLLVLLAPGLGLIAFAFFGSARLGRRRETALRRINATIAERAAPLQARVKPDTARCRRSSRWRSGRSAGPASATSTR